MKKLLARFEAEPTKENAAKIVKYADARMMRLCAVTGEQMAVYDRAYKMARGA